MGGEENRTWSTGAKALAGALLAGCAGILVFSSMLARWSTAVDAGPDEVDRAWAERYRTVEDPRPYLRISSDGVVSADTSLMGDERTELTVFGVMSWSPDDGRLYTVRFPFWFVELKTSEHLNLGTLVSALAGDWERLGLKVTTEELERRGPGIVLDHTMRDGTRLLLWTER